MFGNSEYWHNSHNISSINIRVQVLCPHLHAFYLEQGFRWFYDYFFTVAKKNMKFAILTRPTRYFSTAKAILHEKQNTAVMLEMQHRTSLTLRTYSTTELHPTLCSTLKQQQQKCVCANMHVRMHHAIHVQVRTTWVCPLSFHRPQGLNLGHQA